MRADDLLLSVFCAIALIWLVRAMLRPVSDADRMSEQDLAALEQDPGYREVMGLDDDGIRRAFGGNGPEA